MWANFFPGSPGQGALQLAELGLAFVLSALIGLERELRQKSAGLRTYTVVGLSSALIMLISKYGFSSVIEPSRVVLDPSRVAAQIVSGIGFIGAGVIFVRKDAVRGLTTAATVWLAAAVGMACGGGLPWLAIAVTAAHFLVVGAFPYIERRMPKSRWSAASLRISYQDGRGVLRDVLALITQKDHAVSRLRVEHGGADEARSGFHDGHDKGHGADEEETASASKGIVTLTLEIRGVKSLPKLVQRLSDIPGVVSVNAGEDTLTTD